MKRVLGIGLALFLTFACFYASRYWIFDLWPRDGLAGISFLRPNGNLLAPVLRGTDARPFELILWAVSVFLSLTVVQFLWARIFK